jgi:ActR/RegA family two-component response regulator
MSKTETRAMIRALVEQSNEEKRAWFESLGQGYRYNHEQRAYAFELIEESGVRATARILNTPRRTLQRWCKKHQVFVRRCPSWVYGWAQRRRKRRGFWERRGYC